MAIPPEAILLPPDSQGTLQSRLREVIVDGVLSGRFVRGARLPSSRRLAEHLGISRITVTLAYTELVASDYLSARGRSGYYISDAAPLPRGAPAPKRESTVDWSRAIGQSFSHAAAVHRPKNWRSYRYPFIYGQTDQRLFDHQAWRKCALEAMGRRDITALTSDYYDADDPMLVAQIIRVILPRRGISASEDEVLVTVGAQNALWILAQVLLTQRRTAVMEQPGYPALRDILEQTRCKLHLLDVDDGGLDPAHIPPETDVLFATPSHQCPTGVTMPVARREDLLKRAREHEFVVVEDDYESELGFLGPPSPALKSLDRDGRVAYIGSFSKSLFPGLRLGYIVAPAPLIREARAARALMLRHPPGHLQRSVAYYLSQGHYDAQMERISRTFKERLEVINQEIAHLGLTTATTNTFGGSSLWMRTADRIPAKQLAKKLEERSVLIEPGSAFCPGDPEAKPLYRLAFSSISKEDIPQGLRLIAEAQDSF